MAMLAEPRRKQRVINLRAKNNAWSNDSSKFGQRMLEKMGWTSGKGLGANENGITEHVIARYKNDERGLGFEDKNDQWTKHEDDFNSLLANLSNANDNTENLHSGISLEDKSKKSKARIHYHKFTRGKDISRYSEKDLANIFGKKSFKNTEEVQVPLKEDLKTREKIFTEKGSMEDYFKNKLKSKSKFNAPVVNESHQDYDEPSYAFRGFAQDNDTTEFSNEVEYNQENKINVNYVPCELDNLKSKKKKSKKPNKDDTNGIELKTLCNTEQQDIHIYDEDIDRKNKKKKLKNKMQVVDNMEEVCKVQGSTQEKIKKKKSKNKDKLVENNREESLPDSANGHDISIKNGDTDQIFKNKTKSKKDANKDFSSNTQIYDVNVEQSRKKKSSKNKDFCEDNLISHDIVKKKKTKRKNDQNIEDVAQDFVSGTEYLSKKKKKRKNKENK